MTQIPDHFSDVGLGWRDLLETLHDRLMRQDTSYRVGQVKEKFGSLRVYLDSDETDSIRNIIAEAEWSSERTCEVCGTLGKQVQIRGWWRALCRTHELEASGIERL